MNEHFSFPAWMGPIPRVCAPWTTEEEQELVRGFEAGLTLQQMCKKHGRAEGGINGRLFKLRGENFYIRAQADMGHVEELLGLQQEVRRLAARIEAIINRY